MDTKYHEQYIRFGLKVQYYRKLSGMTQEAFADEIGKSWSFVAKIESPTRPFGVSMETMFKIADVLKVPVSKLFEELIQKEKCSSRSHCRELHCFYSRYSLIHSANCGVIW